MITPIPKTLEPIVAILPTLSQTPIGAHAEQLALASAFGKSRHNGFASEIAGIRAER